MNSRRYIVPCILVMAPLLLQAGGAKGQSALERRVRHELVLLPDYGVFDHLALRVDGDRVTLLGQVTRPMLKNDAEAVVKTVEGVVVVVNLIEVLPLSPNDDRIRLAAYRAIYRYGPLRRYAHQATPPIHIVVKNGDVTLEGVVATETDKSLARIRAMCVLGVFSVTNNLTLDDTN